MSREILIQTHKGERLVAIVERGRVDDFHIEVEHHQSLLGNVYKGRVESILPSINAAFINIGKERNGFLYLTDVVSPRIDIDQELEPRNFLEKIFKRKKEVPAPAPAVVPPPAADVVPPVAPVVSDQAEAPVPAIVTTAPAAVPAKPIPARKHSRDKRHNSSSSNVIPLKVGQEILVQVVKDPFGEKGARLTTHITLPGRFVVYMPYDEQTGISKKIEDQTERSRLRDVITNFSFAKTGGFIIRTASSSQDKKELVRDARFLYGIWEKILHKSSHEKAPALIYEEGELTWKIVRDYLTDKVEKLVIDDEEECKKIKKFVQTLIGNEMVDKIEYYKGDKSLFEFKGVAKDLQTIYDTDVHVRSGAYFVIEPTEAFIVIDVNSGKFKTKASPGEAAFMVNMEVVPEIARQLRLRDLGGIIVIDFIDMVREENKRKIVEALKRALAHDHAKTEVNRISNLGLCEMTRARTGKTIESISFFKCPYCDGRGRVKIG